ncbi:MAG: hypothetical protein ACO307_08695 [Ilumatobacteraceae bacterium]
MTTPSFVGAGTPVTVGPGPQVPATFTVTTADLPAGVAAGDLLFVLVLIGGNGVPVGPYTSADLDAAGYEFAGVRNAPTRQAFILCWAGFYDAADFPADITLVSGAGSFPSTARVETVAYRSVESVPPLTGQTYDTAGTSFSNYLPDPNTQGALAGSETDGLVVQFTYESAVSGVDVDEGYDVGTVYDAEGFTERHRQARIPDFGGGFVVADNSSDLSTAKQFATYNTVNFGHNGVCMQIGLDGKATSGWGVNTINW